MRVAFPLLVAAAVLAAPAVGEAGGGSSGSGAGCNCTPPPPPACCSTSSPSTHTITAPGVNVVPPSVYIAPPHLAGGVSGEGTFGGDIATSLQASSGSSSYGASSSTSSSSAGSSASASILANAAASSTGSVLASGSALATANSQAANLLAASGGGGGGGFAESGVNTSIQNLNVAMPGVQTAPRQVCARYASAVQAVAVQAVCLDDKDVPHPASQVAPGQDVPEGYAGELFRCIAGAHMQYITAAYGGQARFDHGQTVVCGKGEALWRDAAGHLQCRPQTPARDCNERSLLRRYGAGIKVLKASVSGQCAEWRTEGGEAQAASQGSLQLDGGVGG